MTVFLFAARGFISGAFQAAYVYTPEVRIKKCAEIKKLHPLKRVWVLFVGHKTECPQISINLHRLKMMIVYYLKLLLAKEGAVVFEK